MATVQVRMDEQVKVRFEKLADKINAKRKKLNQSKLNSAQILEMAVSALDCQFMSSEAKVKP